VKYRKLRIGWSVAWGVVAVLIGLLWVRSYSWWDNVEWPAMHTHSVYLVSLQGRFGVGVGSVDPQFVVSGFTSDEITDAVEMLPAFHNSPPSFSFDVAARLTSSACLYPSLWPRYTGGTASALSSKCP
jgi:hypothetical protein